MQTLASPDGRWLAVGLAVASLCAGTAVATTTESPFRTRAVKLGGLPGDERVAQHLTYTRSLGFNTIWLPCQALGQPDCLGLDPERLEPSRRDWLAKLVAAGWRIALVSAPHAADSEADSDPESDAELEADPAPLPQRLERRQVRQFRRQIDAWRSKGVDAWVVSARPSQETLRIYDERWTRRYGEGFFWFRPGRRAGGPLPPGFGLVVTAGPEISAGEALTRAAQAEPGRPLWLEEHYPSLRDPFGNVTALNLGPLRERPMLPPKLRGYVAVPMIPYLGASRLSLRTVADYLAAPWDYDPERSWERARLALAGPDEAARAALKTQAVEWGGWFGSLNYRDYSGNRPESALATLRDPAAFASYGWTVKRYAERMRALAGLADPLFGSELLQVMQRRLVLARALPVVRAILDPRFRPELERASLHDELTRQRADLSGDPDALQLFDRFLELAAIPRRPDAGQAAPPPAAEPDSPASLPEPM